MTTISAAAPALHSNMKAQMGDILTSISWREIASRYFGKSSSWLYHKLDGIDGNGGQGGFTPAEAEQLREALTDLARRIKEAADAI